MLKHYDSMRISLIVPGAHALAYVLVPNWVFGNNGHITDLITFKKASGSTAQIAARK